MSVNLLLEIFITSALSGGSVHAIRSVSCCLGINHDWDQSRLTRHFGFIAFAGSSPPSPLRHVAAGLDGGRPGEGKDFLERGDWQPFWQETIVCIQHSRFASLHRKECVDLLRLLQLVYLGLGNQMS